MDRNVRHVQSDMVKVTLKRKEMLMMMIVAIVMVIKMIPISQ